MSEFLETKTIDKYHIKQTLTLTEAINNFTNTQKRTEKYRKTLTQTQQTKKHQKLFWVLVFLKNTTKQKNQTVENMLFKFADKNKSRQTTKAVVNKRQKKTHNTHLDWSQPRKQTSQTTVKVMLVETTF